MYWYIKCFKQYADFTGRARRTEYWMFTLVDIIICIALFIILLVVIFSDSGFYYMLNSNSEYVDPVLIGKILIWLLIYALYYLISLLPKLAVTVRRFHDQEQSGWMALIYLVPYIGWIIIWIFMCLQGTPGENRFGPSPFSAETTTTEHTLAS